MTSPRPRRWRRRRPTQWRLERVVAAVCALQSQHRISCAHTSRKRDPGQYGVAHTRALVRDRTYAPRNAVHISRIPGRIRRGSRIGRSGWRTDGGVLLEMVRSVSFADSPVTGTYVITKSSGPVCPACGSGLNRIPRRFIDRLISIVHYVHRYHCQSFVCNWEGNLRPAASNHWKPLDEYTDSPKRAVTRETSDGERKVNGDGPSASNVRSGPPAQPDPMAREGDTLPVPSSSKAADASGDSRTTSKKAPRRESKRAKSAPR